MVSIVVTMCTHMCGLEATAAVLKHLCTMDPPRPRDQASHFAHMPPKGETAGAH